MPSKVKVIVTGDKKIDRMMRRLGNEKLAKSIVRKAMRQSLKRVLRAAKANVPKDSGALAKAIGIKTRRSRKGLFLAVQITQAGITKIYAKKGKAKGFYPLAIEYGSKHQPAQAPIRKAYDTEAGPARDECLALTRAGILNEAKKG